MVHGHRHHTYLHSNAGILNSINDKSFISPFVLAGNESRIHVSTSGHSFTTHINPYQPLVLQNCDNPIFQVNDPSQVLQSIFE